MTIEIVDFPIKNCDFPWLCKRLPEGKMGDCPTHPKNKSSSYGNYDELGSRFFFELFQERIDG